MALRLASQENLSADQMEVVELAALLHDVGDHKYSQDPEGDLQQIQAFLAGLQLRGDQREAVMYIIRNMGFKEELARGGAAAGGNNPCPLALDVVQDADRLDAIGAVGIARCLTFGGRFNRVLHDPSIPPREQLTKEQYVDKEARQTTLNHFHEKLLKLGVGVGECMALSTRRLRPDLVRPNDHGSRAHSSAELQGLMRTEAGRRVAQQRHEYMEGFLEQFLREWEGVA
ncbi:hypothetical protein N2152v2_010420 [Parachlorella kessleri]